MIHRFASLAHPTKYGYAFDRDAYSRECETCSQFRQFETYGDGLIQHSGDWAVTFEYLADYLASLAAEFLVNEELAGRLSHYFRAGVHVSSIAFAASVVWRESDNDYSKRRYVSMKLEKTGTRAKEHDKRYIEVTKYMDGSLASILRLVSDEYTNGFRRYLLAESIREWAGEQKRHPGHGEGWPEWYGGDWSKNNDLRTALAACRNVCEAYRLRSWVVEWAENKKAALAESAV